MSEIKITFTEEEANVLLQFIDIAIKSEGLKAAEAGYFLATKITKEAEEHTQGEKEE